MPGLQINEAKTWVSIFFCYQVGNIILWDPQLGELNTSNKGPTVGSLVELNSSNRDPQLGPSLVALNTITWDPQLGPKLN